MTNKYKAPLLKITWKYCDWALVRAIRPNIAQNFELENLKNRANAVQIFEQRKYKPIFSRFQQIQRSITYIKNT